MYKNSRGMATAALVLAIMGLGFASSGAGLIFGALAVILAALSRGNSTMFRRARAAILLGVVSMAITIGSLGYVAFALYRGDAKVTKQIEEYIEYYNDIYGDGDDSTLPFDQNQQEQQEAPSTPSDSGTTAL